MADLILHQYADSPFSEKIRALFGYKRLQYKSVEIPPIMPKPDLTALTGGYGRIPVMQNGADIFCDTALIAQVIEAISPQPSIFARNSVPVAIDQPHIDPLIKLAAGASVQVLPTDYGFQAVIGKLLVVDDKRIIVSRQDEQAGHLHVHFPRNGFEVSQPGEPE